MEDVETHEKQILKGWKELEDEKEIIDLEEVQHVCVSGHSLQHTINRLTNHLPSSFCVFVCVCCNKAEKAQLISVPYQVLKEIERKHSKRE